MAPANTGQMTGAPRDASLPPGYDREDPYEGEDLDDYPAWWRRNVEEFREHGMRPYRPPRFSDGETVPDRRADLEAELDVAIRFRAVAPTEGDDWELWVDDSRVRRVPRRRDGDGYTEYGLTGEEFERVVRSFVGQ